MLGDHDTLNLMDAIQKLSTCKQAYHKDQSWVHYFYNLYEQYPCCRCQFQSYFIRWWYEYDKSHVFLQFCAIFDNTQCNGIGSKHKCWTSQHIQMASNKQIICKYEKKSMQFHHSQRNFGHFVPSLKLNSECFEHVSEYNFLGLTIDEWKYNIQKVSNEVSGTLGISCRLKYHSFAYTTESL